MNTPNLIRGIIPLLILVAVSASSAQKTDSDSTTATFVSHSQLVMVPVIITDGRGRPVPGLKKDAFRLEENGKPQDKRIFEEVTTSTAATRSAPATPQQSPGFSNIVATDAQPHRITILVLDMLNTPISSQAKARKELIKYLSKSLDSDEPITLLGFSQKGLQQLHSFTTDTKLLIAALNRISSRFSVQDTHGVNIPPVEAPATDLSDTDPLFDDLADFLQNSTDKLQAFKDRDATRRTLVAFDQIAEAYAGIPGRKTLVWASSGFPFMIDDPQEFGYMGLDTVEAYERTWRHLLSENIAVYPIDLEGLVAPELNAPNLSPGLAIGKREKSGKGSSTIETRDVAYNRHAQQMDAMKAFADATGGTACLNSNDMVKCFKRAVDDSRTYYLLGFYLRPDDRAPGWRKLKVHVSANGVRVRVRDGFYVGAPPKNDAQTRNSAVISGLASPVEFTSIPMTVRWTSRVKVQNTIKGVTTQKTSAGFVINLPPNAFTISGEEQAMDLTVAAVAFDKNGKPVADFSRTLQQKLTPELAQRAVRDGFNFRETIRLPEGTSSIRFLVRDNQSGQMGTVNAPFEQQ